MTSLLNLSYQGQANFLFFAPIMNLFKDPRLLIEDGQYHTEVNKRIVIVGRFSHCNINVKNKVDILFGMNSDEGILLSQFPQVSSMISVKIVSVRHPPQN